MNGKLKFVLAALTFVGIAGVATAKTFDDTLELSRRGLKEARAAAHCQGVVFATWRKNYKKLPAFCDLLRGE